MAPDAVMRSDQDNDGRLLNTSAKQRVSEVDHSDHLGTSNMLMVWFQKFPFYRPLIGKTTSALYS